MPFPSRYTAETLGDRLVITLPARRDWITIVFLGIWSLVWLGVEVTVLSAVAGYLLRGVSAEALAGLAGAAPFAVIWLTVWTFGGLSALYCLAWQMGGRHVIDVSPKGIRLSRQVLGRGRAHTYPAERIRQLRVSPIRWNLLTDKFGRPLPSVLEGTLAFNYGRDIIWFGGNDVAESTRMLKEIQDRFPQYTLR